MNERTDLELDASRAGLALVDWQERLIVAMQPEARERAVKNAVILIEDQSANRDSGPGIRRRRGTTVA